MIRTEQKYFIIAFNKLIISFVLLLLLSACQSNSKSALNSSSYNPSYDPSFTSTGAFMDGDQIKFNGKKTDYTKLPMQQLDNHLGKDLYFNPTNYNYPSPSKQSLTKEELGDWLSIPQIIFGAADYQYPYETWLLPNQNIVGFDIDSQPYHGQIWQRENELCFSYVKGFAECGKLYKAGDGFHFASSQGQYFFHSKYLQSPQTAENFISIVKSRDATQAFINPSQTLVASKSKTTSYTEKKESDDIAIIISNSDYNSQTSNIPNVTPATNDGKAVFDYLTQFKGLSPNNIIHLNNAAQSQMVNAFGSYRNHKGSAFNWVKPGKSNLYVYYAGHGAPSENGGLLIPTDARYDSIELNGYPVSQLLTNLSKIPAKSITVMLESCFSGVSAGGTVVANASPIYIQKPISSVPENINLITAAGPNQIASWQKDKRQSLFTKYLLAGLKGQADSAEYGNEDGKVDQQELQRFLDDTMTYEARRGYGREQSAKVQFTNGFVF